MKTSIKASLVSAAVASVLGTAAHALPAANWTDGTIPASQIFYAGGGSAEVQAVYVAVSKLLNASSIGVYTDGTGSAKHPQSANYLVVNGTLNAAVGSLASGAAVGFIYKYNGGSFPNGGLPQATTTNTLSYPTTAALATGVATGPVANAGPYPSSFNPNFVYTPANTNVETPDWGITDEEEKLFNFGFNLNGANSSKPFTLGGHAQPFYVAPFGVAVTAALYNHKKIWSKAEIASVLSGSILQWSSLNDDAGNPLPASLGQVTFIDRGSGSGTKAAGTDYFLDYPGGSFALGGAVSPNSVNLTLPGNSFPNGGYTGALNTAFPTSSTEIQDIKEASSAAEADDLLAANVAGIGALAILGLEYPPVFEQTNANTNDYFFVAIDGVYPDSETGTDNINTTSTTGSTQYSNIISGAYDFAFQTGFNYHVATTSALPAFQLAVFNNLTSENISGAHTGLAFPSATPGVLLDPKTTGHHDAGNLSWSRGANSAGAAVFVAPAAAALADPLF